MLWKNNQVLRADRNRLGNNQESLLGEVRYWKLRDSSSVASVATLKLTVDEFKAASTTEIQSLKKIILELGIKVKDVKSMTTAETVTTNEINTYFKDSTLVDRRVINYLDTVTPFYQVKIIHYPWSGQVSMKIVYRDKMTQVVYWEKKGFLFWRKKQLRQVINFANPDTQIQYPKYIEITKNNK
jgi:hypothetical protein